MRTFTITLALSIILSAAVGFGCAAKEDNCGSTSGCQPPPENCGDDICRAGEGENAQSCPEDCVPSTCGDGTCSASDGENAENCEADCDVTCLQADLPVYCADTNSCWPADTDCELPTYACHGETLRCTTRQWNGVDASQISCCAGGVTAECPPNRPYWCPAQADCVATTDACPEAASACPTWGFSCRAP
jgi:hypothetical protein